VGHARGPRRAVARWRGRAGPQRHEQQFDFDEQRRTLGASVYELALRHRAAQPVHINRTAVDLALHLDSRPHDLDEANHHDEARHHLVYPDYERPHDQHERPDDGHEQLGIRRNNGRDNALRLGTEPVII
jgi:hypothetical protein